jgi:hypothetical protein
VFDNFSVQMDSYIIEIWWMRDNMLTNAQVHTAPAPLFENYIFYSNTLRLYQNGSNQNYYVTTPINANAVNLVVNTHLSETEWNKFVFHCRYSNPRSTFELFVFNRFSSKVSVGSTIIPNQYLQYIAFCHQDPSSCRPGNNIYWSSGYYRNMRVWNGDLADPWVLSQYDD